MEKKDFLLRRKFLMTGRSAYGGQFRGRKIRRDYADRSLSAEKVQSFAPGRNRKKVSSRRFFIMEENVFEFS